MEAKVDELLFRYYRLWEYNDGGEDDDDDEHPYGSDVGTTSDEDETVQHLDRVGPEIWEFMKARARDDTDDEDEVDHVGAELFDFMCAMQSDGDTNDGVLLSTLEPSDDENGPGVVEGLLKLGGDDDNGPVSY